MTPQNTVPPTCRACGHVALVSITQGGRVERYDRCGHPSGPHPQNEFCAWRTPKTEVPMGTKLYALPGAKGETK